MSLRVALIVALLLVATFWSSAILADITFRSGSGGQTTSGPQLWIGLPPGTVQDDVMIASIGIQPSSATVQAPAGWTLVKRIDNPAMNSNSLWVFRKTAGASEPSAYFWTISGYTYAVIGMQCFSGVNTTNPIDVEAGQTTPSGVSHSTPSINTTVAHTMLVTSHTFSSATTNWNPVSAGMTEAYDWETPAAPPGAGQTIAGYSVAQAAAGATGIKTATTSGGEADVGNTHILALRPAPPELACTFASDWTTAPCSFFQEYKGMHEDPPLPPNPGASIVNIGRDGGTAVRLHTEPGDNQVAGSGLLERNDLFLAETAGTPPTPINVPIFFGEGQEQWWAHSILFPQDFAIPTWHPYLVFDFHEEVNPPCNPECPPPNPANGAANFHAMFHDSSPGNLIFLGFGGPEGTRYPPPGEVAVAIPGPIEKDVWYDFVYHVKWSSGADGFFKAWVNGVKKLDHTGPTLYPGRRVYLKLANYHLPICEPWRPGEPDHCASQNPPPQPPSSVIHDRIMRGTSKAAVSLTPLEP
jgi:hypothetical protein